MRIITLLLCVFTLTPVAYSGDVQTPVMITLDDVTKRVSNENFTVYANALRVYQAKERIQVARGDLLPKLNIWKITGAVVGTVTDPVSLVAVINDVAPFLVPANWFRFEQAKILYNVEKEGYRALWVNELYTAKALYLDLLRDQSLLEHIRSSQAELDKVRTIVQTQEMLGGAPQGTSKEIEVRFLSLIEDERSLEVLIAEEENSLSFMLGFAAEIPVRPTSVDMSQIGDQKPLRYEDFEFRAIDSSPELRQFDHLMSVVDSIGNEVKYSFLGTSSASRGVAGGIFDNLLVPDGLGFGTGAAVRVTQAQKQILQVQRRGIEETIKRQLRLLIDNYNLDLESYANLKRRAELTHEMNVQLYERMRLGQNVSPLELIEASRVHIQADTSFFAVQYRFLANEDRLARLIFFGDYTKQPIVIEKLKKR